MARQRFHRGIEYALYGDGEYEPHASIEFVGTARYPTLAKFQDDRVRAFWLRRGDQERFVRGVLYEVVNDGNRVKLKYVSRIQIGARILLMFRKRRVAVKATAP